MKNNRTTLFVLALSLLSFGNVLAQEEMTIVAPTSEAAEGLDLHAVSEIFKDSKNLEEFEKVLNDEDHGVNNLDLNEDGEVDFIRVVEEVADETHVIILQAALGKDEFQDVATIEVEKSGDEDYNMQVHGNEVIYGADYYVAPTVVHVHTWPLIGWIYRPYYRPYRSAFYFGFYPRWYRPWRPVTVNVYRTRTVRYTNRATFSVTRTSRVRTVTKVNYKPRSSTLVKKRTVTRKTTAGGRTTTVKGSRTVKNRKTGKTTTVKAGVKKTKNPKTGRTTVKKGAKKTTTKGGKKKTVAKGKKTTRKKKKR
jgi:hypothetical protein